MVRKTALFGILAFLAFCLPLTMLALNSCTSDNVPRGGNPAAPTTGAQPAVAPDPQPTNTDPRSAVELAESFKIANDKGNISHTPGVLYTKDGKSFLCGTNDGTIVIWDRKTGKEIRRIECTKEPLTAVSADPDGTVALWSNQKGVLGAVDLRTGKTIATANLTSNFVSVAPKGDIAAVATGTGIEIRKTRDLSTLKQLTVGGTVQQIAWSNDGTLVAAVDDQGNLAVYDTTKAYRSLYAVKKPTALYAVAFTPDKSAIAYGGYERVVYQYEFAKEKEDWIAKDQPYYITALGYTPNGKKIAIGDESCDIWVNVVATKERVFHSKHHVECWLNSVTFTPEGDTFVFGCRPNSLAGKPAIYSPLNHMEAAQSQTVKACDRQIADQREKIDKWLNEGAHRETKARIDGLVAKRDEAIRKKYGGAQTPKPVDPSTIPAQQIMLPQTDLALSSDPSLATLQQYGGGAGGGHAIINDPEIKTMQDEIDKLNGEVRKDKEVDNLYRELDNLGKRRQEEYNKEVKKLEGSFNLNQWKLND